MHNASLSAKCMVPSKGGKVKITTTPPWSGRRGGKDDAGLLRSPEEIGHWRRTLVNASGLKRSQKNRILHSNNKYYVCVKHFAPCDRVNTGRWPVKFGSRPLTDTQLAALTVEREHVKVRSLRRKLDNTERKAAHMLSGSAHGVHNTR